ncbi:MAG: hydroxyacylglutathione hydrolase [Desulfuromonadaceae bacterium]|nr:hydroxyacylglutathione hydrolase [Desulfuromonas sp.]MDY0184294.1 hydroxyacylglutathione hydrolase [Desulfuromonadaceae bacterium]
MPRIAIIPIHQDNYSYILSLNGVNIAIDPGEAEPVMDHLREQKCGLDVILNTHMHQDHSHGNLALKQATGCKIMGRDERIPGIDQVLTQEGALPAPVQKLQMLATPGHTLKDCCYYLPPQGEHPGALFSGDTLFSGGCGRVFEGTIEQLFQSLQTLAALPPETLIYCGHEYTLDNYRFAERMEPNSLAVRRKRQQVESFRQRGEPSLPVSVGEELETNPFLRPHDPALRRALHMEDASDLEIFTILREKKNRF